MRQPENDTLLPLLSNIVARLAHCPFVATFNVLLGRLPRTWVIIVKYVVAFESRVSLLRHDW